MVLVHGSPEAPERRVVKAWDRGSGMLPSVLIEACVGSGSPPAELKTALQVDMSEICAVSQCDVSFIAVCRKHGHLCQSFGEVRADLNSERASTASSCPMGVE